ncbi:hypothetical protein DFH28DRAFT_1083219 [Melampsora americana]|nr:hypothetical protein DFH28DRAFT_1083219 [Melampsora americana]
MSSSPDDVEGPKLEHSMIEGLKIQEELYKKKLPDHIKKERRSLQLHLWHEEFFNKNLGPEIFNYILGEKCTTRHFKKAELYYPELRAGVLALTKARLGLFPSNEAAFIESEKKGSLTPEALEIGKRGCPLCRECLDDRNGDFTEEIDHLLIQCTSLNELRDEHLTAIIADLSTSSVVRGEDRCNQVKSLSTLLMGGMCLPRAQKGAALRTFLKEGSTDVSDCNRKNSLCCDAKCDRGVISSHNYAAIMLMIPRRVYVWCSRALWVLLGRLKQGEA